LGHEPLEVRSAKRAEWSVVSRIVRFVQGEVYRSC